MLTHRITFIALATLLSTAVAHEAAAAPTTRFDIIERAGSFHDDSIDKIYHYRGRYYPYRYRGMYFRHRYYRHGRWHYY
jgi:hypothetical protein